ncbi:MAG: hypothetical protein V1754_14095 [Pseudomonadota bacterium]
MSKNPHPHSLSPEIRSRYSSAQVMERMCAIDLMAVDIDECLFPGFSQTALGHLIFRQIATRPRSVRDLRFLPQLIRGGMYIRSRELLKKLRRNPTSLELMRRYERAMEGIPRRYFLDGAKAIPHLSFPGALRTLRFLGKFAPVGLLSFGINIIAEEYVRQLRTEDQPDGIFFSESNEISFSLNQSGIEVFSGYNPPLRTQPEEKRRTLEEWLERYGARCPLVIGNSRDEVEMAALAREKNGIAVGFRPPPDEAAQFDLIVHSNDWLELSSLFENLLGQNK